MTAHDPHQWPAEAREGLAAGLGARPRGLTAARWLLLTAPPVAAWACAWWLR